MCLKGLTDGCSVRVAQVVFPNQFLAPGTSWLYSIAGTVWCTYIVTMFTFHCQDLSSSSSRFDALAHTHFAPIADYKACTVRPGSPADHPRPSQPHPSLAERISSTLACLPPNRTRPGPAGERTRRGDMREATAVQQRHHDSDRDHGRDGWAYTPPAADWGAGGNALSREEEERAERSKGRVCKKCVPGLSGMPAKPGEWT